GAAVRARANPEAASQTSAGRIGSRYRGPHWRPPCVPVATTAAPKRAAVTHRNRSQGDPVPRRSARTTNGAAGRRPETIVRPAAIHTPAAVPTTAPDTITGMDR